MDTTRLTRVVSNFFHYLRDMKTLHLDRFEDEIARRILERGYEYFEDERVSEPRINGNHYTFAVDGSERYCVEMDVEDGNVTDYECDCPYDMGPVCKHIAACLYFLEDASAASNPDASAPTNTDTTPANSYEQRIAKAVKLARNRYGFISYEESADLAETLRGFLDEAESAISARECLDICLPLLDWTFDAMESADDSDGEFCSLMDDTIDAIGGALLYDDVPQSVCNHAIDYCLKRFREGKFAYYGWHSDLLDLAAQAAESAGDKAAADKVLAAIDEAFPPEYNAGNWRDTTDFDKAIAAKHKLLLLLSSPAEAENFLQEHIGNERLRRYAIERAFSQRDYREVYRLADGGAKFDAKDKPGLLNTWLEFKMKAALLLEDEPTVVSVAQDLWIDGRGGCYLEGCRIPDYYAFLKERIPAQRWPAFMSAFIDRYERESHYLSDSYADILVREERWDKLLAYVSKAYRPDTLKKYEKYLKADYRREILDLYKGYVYNGMSGNKLERRVYQRACACLRHMKKLGAHAEVAAIKADLLSRYPRRPALIDELDNV